MTALKTQSELAQEVANYTYHHTSWHRGYVSRKISGIIQPYSGRFGKGIVIYTPSWQSSQYCRVSYYQEAKCK